MSQRYEITNATDTPLRILTPDTAPAILGEDNICGHALVIGYANASAFAVVGSREQLHDFARRVADTVADLGHDNTRGPVPSCTPLPRTARQTDWEQLARQAADFTTRYQRAVDAFRIPAEDGQDPSEADIDPDRYEAYDEMRADWGEAALSLVERLTAHARPRTSAT